MATLRRLKRHIKSMFVSMLYQIWNLRYFRHIMIISYVRFEHFLLTINLDAVSFPNIFNSLISMCICKVLFLINEISVLIIKKKIKL